MAINVPKYLLVPFSVMRGAGLTRGWYGLGGFEAASGEKKSGAKLRKCIAVLGYSLSPGVIGLRGPNDSHRLLQPQSDTSRTAC